jgi:hypothetical protein
MINLQNEEFGKAAEVAPGFWIIATRHRPGLSKHMFEINNRCLIFKIQDQTTNVPALLVINATDPQQTFAEVHRIEQETGLKVKYVVSPGGGHHMMMDSWSREFPDAQLLVGPVRVPRTGNGKKLMQLPNVSTLSEENPLPMATAELDAVLFRGLNGLTDRTAPGEGGSDTLWSYLLSMIHVLTQVKDPIDELWIHHKATNIVVGGENLGWYYTKEGLQNQAFMLKGMVKPDQLYLMNMARKVVDAELVKKCWEKILSWTADTVLTYHEQPGVGFTGNGQDALRKIAQEAKQI